MSKKIINPVTLLYENSTTAGPGRVVKNLELGLTKLSIEHGHKHILQPVHKAYIGLLQTIATWQNYKTYGSILCGPNLFVLPSDNPELCKSFKHFIVPSKWVYDLYRQFSELDHATIDIWPVGIDTEYWCPNKSNAPITPRIDSKPHGMIYLKGRSSQDLNLSKRLIEASGAILEGIITYGQYQEHELKEMCSKIDFAILLTGTESQGIAYQQILSCNIPCYVFNKSYWDNEGKCYKKVEATSVPYFNEKCGIIADNNISVSKFRETFLDKLSEFNPRSYIEDNLGLEKQAMKYYQFLERYQK